MHFIKFIQFLCFLVLLSAIFNGDFGFVPLTGAGSLGNNTARVLIYLGAIYPIVVAIKSSWNKKKINDTPKGDN